jgi:membrane associated rhomboid family serine protease
MARSAELVRTQATELATEVKQGTVTLATTTAALWGVSFVNWIVFAGALTSWGIVPRSFEGLIGILFAPFLHAGLAHLMVNTVSLWLLGPLMMLRKRMDFFVVAAFGALTSGLAAWLLGWPGSVHIGFSGVLFAFLGFLVARGFYERKVQAIALSIAVTWLFGGALWALLPFLVPGVSWQSHLGGFIGGILAARALAGRRDPS